MSLASPPNRGQLSVDGHHWWDGQAWQPVALPAQLPAAQPVQISAGQAFRFGFFAFFGALVASFAFWVLALIALLIFGAAIRSAVTG